VAEAQAGSLYGFRLDDEPKIYPDPASRFQPQGIHGPSEVVDPAQFAWSDQDWPGVELKGQILYELHLGTFTPEGTWAAAAGKLSHLRDLGVTVVEVMPVAEFDGQFGWGYDGVYWFAPTRLYGRPDDFRRFVDAAHGLGLGVILDVVYNHFGPTGNYTGAFSDHYVHAKHKTDWGDAINYDGEQAEPVRAMVASNGAYWVSEFHLDGLRLDATQTIYDDSPRHVLADLSESARRAAGKRSIVIFAENEAQQVRHVEPVEQGGYGLDGVWNDDFHHACRVAATGHAEFYYADYAGTPQELVSATRWGFLYQGQWNPRQQTYRGSPTWDLPAARFVHFLQNHDQVANSAHGLRTRLLTSPGRYRALTALLLLGPATPMLFMGQEFAASNPFLFFADHEVRLADLVRDGRREFMRQFPRVAGQESDAPDPSDARTFELCKLDWREREKHHHDMTLHADLIRLRKSDPVFAAQDRQMLHGGVLADEAFFLRWRAPGDDDRLMLVNLGRDRRWRPAAEPLMAAPAGRRWRLLWSSEEPRYGGSGTAMLNIQDWVVPGHTAIVLTARK
jgi:maltooligosyltrehalose trehalohydrolase